MNQIESKAPCFSVVIPTYNRCELLRRAVKSVLAQTESDYEIIIADDGSLDDTPAVFRNYDDPRVRYLQLPHKGACAARNEGITAANGKYIALLDSDDVWRPEKLAVQKRQIESTQADVIFCGFLLHSIDKQKEEQFPSDEVLEGRIEVHQLLSRNLVSTQTLFGKAEVMKGILFDESFPRMQDWEYAIRLAKNVRLVYFKSVLADVYLQKDSISNHPERGLGAIRLLYSKYQEDYLASPDDLQAIMVAHHIYAVQCRELCMKEHFRMAFSCRRGIKKATMVYSAIKFSAKELLTIWFNNGKEKTGR